MGRLLLLIKIFDDFFELFVVQHITFVFLQDTAQLESFHESDFSFEYNFYLFIQRIVTKISQGIAYLGFTQKSFRISQISEDVLTRKKNQLLEKY